MSKVQTITKLRKGKSKAIIVKLKNKNKKMNTKRIDWKFSWEGLEKERKELVDAAQLLFKCSNECGYDDTTFFARSTMAFHNGSDNKLDDLMGNCLRTIRKLQFDLVHLHHLNWEFVYREWSVITNPNSFQEKLTSDLIAKAKNNSIE